MTNAHAEQGGFNHLHGCRRIEVPKQVSESGEKNGTPADDVRLVTVDGLPELNHGVGLEEK